MSTLNNPVRKGPLKHIFKKDGTSTWLVYGTYQGDERIVGTYATESAAVAGYQEYLLGRALQLFDPLTTEQTQHLTTSAHECRVLAPFLMRVLKACQPLHLPAKRAYKPSRKI